MTSRERIQTILNFEIPDRVGICESFWFDTVERWRTEGLPADSNPDDYFQTEIRRLYIDTSFRLPSQTLEETDEYIITSDSNGMTSKNWKTHSGTPQLIDFRVKTRDDWEELKPLLSPDNSRIDWNWTHSALNDYRKQNKYVTLDLLDPYEAAWRWRGPEQLLIDLIEDPELVDDMFNTFADLAVNMADQMLQGGGTYDGAWIYGDIAYRNGLLFSPATYRERLLKPHQKMMDFFRQKKLPVIYHSCGNITEAVPLLIEAGITCLQPMEAKAGVDVRQLKETFGGRLCFMGNIDVLELSKDKKAVENEILSKLPVAMKGGGYIFHSDHSVPSSVCFENYQYAIELVHQYGQY